MVCPVFSTDIMYCFEVISSSKILGSHRGVEEDYSLVGCETVLLVSIVPGDLQNFQDCSPTNASSHPRNWNLKFQRLDEVTRVISVLTLWCVL